MTTPVAAATRVAVRIPGLLRAYTAGAERVDILLPARPDAGAPRLGDALAALDDRYPGLRFRIVDEQGKVRPHIRLFVDCADTRDLGATLPVAAELMIVGALSGG